ncbi:DNA polymerase III subunit gamma/tau [Veillonella agrestimuris]|uniref:DNA polymerase III subunit gamma/tau n=1 Tax=Veillonella agrestimuris TaxID=2941340 RepID=UPI002040C298|nr:DNA polymerase III subunit gamma/tau [Veillonella agrestimuris]
MAYIALYRKYRPQTFTDVVGQDQVSHTLMRAIRDDKVAHAYLFAGPRGTGKTSMAKIFARAINCEHGPTDHPCNECAACKSILSGQSMDVLEIDAASNRGIDEIRSLRESVRFMPVEGRKKVFIIDEAHMLTNEAWNALLKTIEEPPDHVMFIFATTEIEKLPVTIISRCQRYTFRRITSDDIAKRLQYVAHEEGFVLDENAARLIAVHADGGLRDALSILDQCVGMATGDITPAVVEELIGLVSKDWIIQFLEAIHSGDGAEVLRCLQQALSEGRDGAQIMEALIQHLRMLLIAKVAPDADELKVYDSFRDEFSTQAERIDFTEINQYIKSLQNISNDAKQVDNPRTIIEMGLLVLAAGTSRVETDIDERLHALELAERKEREAVLNRLTKLESQGPAMGAFPPGGYTVPSPSVMNTNMAQLPMNGGAIGTTSMHSGVTGITPPSLNRGVGMTPPPMNSGMGMMPPPMNGGTGMIPPPMSRGEASTTQNRTSSARGRGKKSGISQVATISDTMVSAGEYRNMQGNVIKYLRDSNQSMHSSVLGQGQLIYVDREKAVMAFKNKLHLNLLAKDENRHIVALAFQYALGYPVYVEIVDALTPIYKEYKQASGAKNNRAVPPKQAAPQPVVQEGPPPESTNLLEDSPTAVNEGRSVAPTDNNSNTVRGGIDSEARVSAKNAALAALAARGITPPTTEDVPITGFDGSPVSAPALSEAVHDSVNDSSVGGAKPQPDLDEGDGGEYVFDDSDEFPVESLSTIEVVTDDGEVVSRPMDSGMTVEVESVPKSNDADANDRGGNVAAHNDITANETDEIVTVEPIDSVTVKREYAWDPANLSEEEKNNPLLATTLEKLSEDHDIIVEVIEE